MIALLYIAFFVAYGLVTIFVINKSYGFTKLRYGKGWVGGWLAALVMYNLVFWDWIPVYVMHKYYCSTEAGFWVYKSPEQWIKEHPGMVGEKWGNDYGWPVERLSNDHWKTWYSSKIYSETLRQPKFLHGLRKNEQSLVDSNTGMLLARVVQFEKINESALSVGNAAFTDFKVWLAIGGNSCINPNGKDYQLGFAENFRMLIKLGQGCGK
ncbi:hypothetical protein SAMN05216600_1354 [Pseudomonas cuatrocienegasensis]|uniref:Uncharacterized protein n=1 Tax=Pseudomonas cuatrocienegasensis TaxID=543360 RepID=A0ABY1BRS4_9PSED|nr:MULTISPECIES: hypothetical protein [Pseudomonas]OEC32598.1 hypothetical protein A7D25_23280 [Pseudomonas sp. 21C1]SER47384.1 hypothetical protein SAMN05216600_1354 [Pseudomonas cuatrocienegasensis]